MTETSLELLARVVLPQEVLSYFEIVKIERTATEIHLHLDEKMSDALKTDVHFESKGFTAPVCITDFPIRDHKVVLILRRRWLDIRTGTGFIPPLDIAAEGTRYSKEFVFLKDAYGYIPDNLPYT